MKSFKEIIEAKEKSKAKNFKRRGGNGPQVAWLITLNNKKTKKVDADSRENAKNQLSPEQLILGVKSIKKIPAED